jgi:hypothetical protein
MSLQGGGGFNGSARHSGHLLGMLGILDHRGHHAFPLSADEKTMVRIRGRHRDAVLERAGLVRDFEAWRSVRSPALYTKSMSCARLGALKILLCFRGLTALLFALKY